MTQDPKSHAKLTCPYCATQQVHSQSFKPEAHECYECQRTFVVVPHLEIRRVEGELSSFKRAA